VSRILHYNRYPFVLHLLLLRGRTSCRVVVYTASLVAVMTKMSASILHTPNPNATVGCSVWSMHRLRECVRDVNCNRKLRYAANHHTYYNSDVPDVRRPPPLSCSKRRSVDTPTPTNYVSPSSSYYYYYTSSATRRETTPATRSRPRGRRVWERSSFRHWSVFSTTSSW
jgi:hypothetical protein